MDESLRCFSSLHELLSTFEGDASLVREKRDSRIRLLKFRSRDSNTFRYIILAVVWSQVGKKFFEYGNGNPNSPLPRSLYFSRMPRVTILSPNT